MMYDRLIRLKDQVRFRLTTTNGMGTTWEGKITIIHDMVFMIELKEKIAITT